MLFGNQAKDSTPDLKNYELKQADARFETKGDGQYLRPNVDDDFEIRPASKDDIRPTRPIFSNAKERPNVGRPRPNN